MNNFKQRIFRLVHADLTRSGRPTHLLTSTIALVALISSGAIDRVFAAPNEQVAIASAHPLATQAGFEVLDRGGNVFDAAVAVSAALAVVEPAGSGLGGGGFWLVQRATDEQATLIDGREKAPLAADENLFLDNQGQVQEQKSKQGGLAAGIPGLPAALVHIAKRYGKLPLTESLAPAIRYAREGFAIGEKHRRLLTLRQHVLQQDPAALKIFFANGEVPAAGSLLVQRDLGWTLEQLALYGTAGFYQGQVAQKLLAAVQAKGGIWSQRDLDSYQVVRRQPILSQYRGIRVVSASLPSSGGIVLTEALNILSAYRLDQLPNTLRMHVIVEAMRRAYHDRAVYLGDSDFVSVPVAQLLSPDYAAGRSRSIRFDRVLPSEFLTGEYTDTPKGADTTHFSIIDTAGNRVAATLSINFPFGAAFVAAGTGVLLNNEMDDFSSKPGTMNGYGLIGGVANAIEPGKRMLSSMTPTFLEDAGRIAVLGTPGGSRIISMVLLGVLDFAQNHPAKSWVSLGRFHHQYVPDLLQYEPGALTADEITGLAALGHNLKEIPRRYGNMQAVQLEKISGQLTAASDPRGEGLAMIR